MKRKKDRKRIRKWRKGTEKERITIDLRCRISRNEEKEIIIDVPLAIKCSLSSALWPLLAFKEMTTGEMFAKKEEITVSPR